jgi:hypothetical protein
VSDKVRCGPSGRNVQLRQAIKSRFGDKVSQKWHETRECLGHWSIDIYGLCDEVRIRPVARGFYGKVEGGMLT